MGPNVRKAIPSKDMHRNQAEKVSLDNRKPCAFPSILVPADVLIRPGADIFVPADLMIKPLSPRLEPGLKTFGVPQEVEQVGVTAAELPGAVDPKRPVRKYSGSQRPLKPTPRTRESGLG